MFGIPPIKIVKLGMLDPIALLTLPPSGSSVLIQPGQIKHPTKYQWPISLSDGLPDGGKKRCTSDIS